MFSKTCEYAIRATLYIAQQSEQGERVSMKAIAAAIDSPVAFTAKILQTLAREQVINSIKGPTGGFEIATRKLNEITLKQVVLAIDGDKLFTGCALGLRACNASEPCPLHFKFITIRESLNQTLQQATLKSLASDLISGTTILKK